MRIFLFPLTSRRTLLYCTKSTSTGPPTIQDRIITKATTTWTEWERSQTKWKLTLTEYGNKAFSRLPYEEWALKTLPALSAASASSATQTSVIYPAQLLPGGASAVPKVLKQLAEERQALHKKRMWASIVGMPFTIPVGLIPLIPNIPFFYLAFRAWSHYKALYGARYLAFLLDRGLVVVEGSKELDGLYGREARRTIGEAEEKLLLNREKGREIALKLGLEGVQVEIERAVDQVQGILKKEAAERKDKSV